MRSSRLLNMLMLCRTRERWTATELAEQLEVSVRTVYRDVEALQAAGVPLWTTTGPGGGIHLLPGWRTDLGALTGDEAAALSLAGAPDALAQLGLASVAASAQRKMSAALPPELRAHAARIGQRVHLDAAGWFRRDEPTDHLRVVADAVWSSRRIDVRYRRGDRTVRRRLDPLGLVMKAGTWYLVAAHRGDVRSYRVGRIVGCVVREESSRRPEDFDLAAWWAASSAAFDRSLLRVECRLRCSPTGRRRLPEAVGVTAATTAEPMGPPDDRGRVELRVRGESLEVLADQLLALGADVEVVAPPELRRAVGQRLRAALEPYRVRSD